MSGQTHEILKLMPCVNKQEWTIINGQFVIIKKRIDSNFSGVCSVIDHEFCHYIAKVVVNPLALWIHSPRGSTYLVDPQTTLTML